MKWHANCSKYIHIINKGTVVVMKVVRERPSQRLHHRVTAPISIMIEGVEYDVIDWSLGGFAIAKGNLNLNINDEILCKINVSFQGFNISFDAHSKVVRDSDDGVYGFIFKQINDRERELLSHFIDELIRGSMTSIDDIILRIDTPVTPVSTKADPNPDKDVPLKRRAIKSIITSAVYLLIGFFVISYSFLVLYNNFFSLEINTAVVSAPVEPIYALHDGKIHNVFVNEMQAVEKNNPLIIISNSELRHKLDLAKIEVERKMLHLSSQKMRFDSEKDKMKQYKIVAASEIERFKSKESSILEQMKLTNNQVNRFTELYKKGLTTLSKLDEYKVVKAELKGQLDEVQELLDEKRKLVDNIQKGRFFTGGKFDGKVNELKANLDYAASEVVLASDELKSLENRAKSLILRSPSNGVVVKILKNVGSTVKRGDEVALFENSEQRRIEAFLNQDEILKIGLGDIVSVYFPSIDEKIQAIVSDIDRTSGYINDIDARYQWRGSKDRTAKVTMDFINIPFKQIRQKFKAGLPAIVIFNRKSNNMVNVSIRKTILNNVTKSERQKETIKDKIKLDVQWRAL
jgi:multidrug resistance efflux pump